MYDKSVRGAHVTHVLDIKFDPKIQEQCPLVSGF